MDQTPCRVDGCLRDATHGVYWNRQDRYWATGRMDRGYMRYLRSERDYCHWHATVQAVLRNAESPEAAEGTSDASSDEDCD